MKSLWNSKEAKNFLNDPLKLRVYTSRLLGQEPSLVLHGGGNTSVKARVQNFLGQWEDVLYIKGSGWDLATIEAKGFAAVKMPVLLAMAELKNLSDTDMVREQRAAMLDPNSPNPSVEAILHAIIPFRYVDHSHSDAVAAITNTPQGAKHIQKIYGNKVLIVPYVMPGFILARKIFELTRRINWKNYKGIVLLNHGLFTFADDAKVSYENHIRLVTKAENYIGKHKVKLATAKTPVVDLEKLARIRAAVSKTMGGAVIANLHTNEKAVGFAKLKNVSVLATRGTLTPDHVIRTKPTPVILKEAFEKEVAVYAEHYQTYFKRHAAAHLKRLDPAPRWAVWKDHGFITFGRSQTDATITADIAKHTLEAIQVSEKLGGWKVLSQKDIFEMEYWELEQAKLAKTPKPLNLQGKIAIVTGAASGIGKACVESLVKHGAVVGAVDIDPGIKNQFSQQQVLGLLCDVTKSLDLTAAVTAVVRKFGGLDIVVSNAGIFPPSKNLNEMDESLWEKSLNVNLTSHQKLLTAAEKYLRHGIDPTFLIIGSKNVPAPGPGAAAYSVAKAGLTQMARVAALELGPLGIRVNVIHPNQIFDTAIWTKEVLEKRAKAYKMSVEEYKKNNILKTEITSYDVAELVACMAGAVFAKTTGAQIPIDGGNDRVI